MIKLVFTLRRREGMSRGRSSSATGARSTRRS